jgi:hypothetical protein
VIVYTQATGDRDYGDRDGQFGQFGQFGKFGQFEKFEFGR